MSDIPRLIEKAFPLKQASIDSVHEKNVRHGHISTLHIWPARRPLAACRAALIATLLPDPGTPEKRKELCEKIGGKVVKKIERKRMPGGKIVEREKEETEGGILHWGRETENAADLEWFREEIKKAYGGRAPRVLDPFAGGGAIPLEAMRLGCEATAIDINPVAWFILKCTLEYPQKLAGKTFPLPDFILKNDEFMDAFYKAHPYYKKPAKSKAKMKKEGLDAEQIDALDKLGVKECKSFRADLSWHVRAWGQWVLDIARKELAQYYPTYADFEPIDKSQSKAYERQEMKLVPLKGDGTADIGALNKEFSEEYLRDKTNPRWVAKPTVAYLWARTVTCKNCRATIPLLKTRWLCKKEKKRVLLTMEPNAEKTGVVFGIQNDVPVVGGNTAQKREHDKKISAGTMSRSGARCPCCRTIMTMEDIRIASMKNGLGFGSTAAVLEGTNGKEYYIHDPLYSAHEDLDVRNSSLSTAFEPASTRSISCHLYGVSKYEHLFSKRQKYSLNVLSTTISSSFDEFTKYQYVPEWKMALHSMICLSFDRLLAFSCVNVRWKTDAEAVVDAFSRYSISLLWDFAEPVPINSYAGSWKLCYERIATAIDTYSKQNFPTTPGNVSLKSATDSLSDNKLFDVIMTDPPYYEAISYADLADFFYVWLKQISKISSYFQEPIIDKSKEIVQHINEKLNRNDEKLKYENGMANAFKSSFKSLNDNGRFIIVFAHKDPNAWETLVNAMIKSGFVVTASWPIATEMQTRQRASTSAALSSSVWLVCKKRPTTARPGWDNLVLEEMRTNIAEQLRDFWDAGIRGPDFVWAATGPALEAYSKHPVVKKANEPGSIMAVSEFLNHVRRIVVDFVVGRVLSGDKGEQINSSTDRLDEPTAYYLLHRNDFGMDEAPAGSCILYAVSCGLSDKELADTWDLIGFTKGASSNDSEDDETGEDETTEKSEETSEESSGSKVKLKVWNQRKGKSLGYEAPGGKSIPLIDRVHRLMHLWKTGDVHKVDEYLDDNALRRQEIFKRLLQSLIELSDAGSEERSILESLSNHVGARGARIEENTLNFDN